jgi:hypothetical protein
MNIVKDDESNESKQEIYSTLSLEKLNSDEILQAFIKNGYFILKLPESIKILNEKIFKQFILFDKRKTIEKEIFSLTNIDDNNICENNGYHPIGGLSNKYNICRDGYIFQANCKIWPMLSNSKDDVSDSFSVIHEEWRPQVHNIALEIMSNLAIALKLDNPTTYFTSKGPLGIIEGSQFHVKKINFNNENKLLNKSKDDERLITLNSHCDPSVISLVFHNKGSTGLQFRDSNLKTFVDLKTCGYDYVTVIAGSVLELLSNGYIKAPAHRVVSTNEELISNNRIAATFFFQPNLDTLLVPFNNNDQILKKKKECNSFPSSSSSSSLSSSSYPSISYHSWKNRAYGNYYKGKESCGK